MSNYIKYHVVIDGVVIKWSGYVYAKTQEDAFDTACEIAQGFGEDFTDVLLCYPCEVELD